MSPHERGEQICQALKLGGQKPVWMECTDDQIANGFELISEHPTWTKATHADAIFATPLVFNAIMNEWRDKVRRDIAIGTPSEVVAHMIRCHGMDKVQKVLEAV